MLEGVLSKGDFLTLSFSQSLPGGFDGFTSTPSAKKHVSVGTSTCNLIFQNQSERQELLSEISQLSNRLDVMTGCNGGLLQQLHEKEKIIFNLKHEKVILEKKTECYDKLKLQYVNAQRELLDLKSRPMEKQDQCACATISDLNDSRLTDKEIIIKLQKQLQTEQLNSHSLRAQLQTERNHAARQAYAGGRALSSYMNGNHVLNGSDSLSVANSDALGIGGLIHAAMPESQNEQVIEVSDNLTSFKPLSTCNGPPGYLSFTPIPRSLMNQPTLAKKKI